MEAMPVSKGYKIDEGYQILIYCLIYRKNPSFKVGTILNWIDFDQWVKKGRQKF